MKTVDDLTHTVAYDLSGRVAPVVLQHGLLSNRTTGHTAVYVDALADRYPVICIDSLGRGDSDKPTTQDRYARPDRPADVVAVMDARGRPPGISGRGPLVRAYIRGVQS
jgi:pimeloyl-ACP methyl ester carboxylesterase